MEPLIDWLTARPFIAFGSQMGPVSEQRCALALIVLPHALGAEANRESSVYRLHLTLPPVDVVKLRMGNSSGKEVVLPVENMRGVTIGDVLHLWKAQAGQGLHLPFMLFIAAGESAEIHQGRMSAWMDQELYEELICVNDGLNNGRSFVGVYLNSTPKKYEGAMNTWSESTERIWFTRTLWGKDGWWDVSRKERDRGMVEMLLRMRKDQQRQEWCFEREFPCWPALALPQYLLDELENGAGDVDRVDELSGGKNIEYIRKSKKMYKVDYACGLVFNRQDVDLNNIWI